MKTVLTIVALLPITAVTCGEQNPEFSAEDIAESVRIGDAAAEQAAPFDFSLPDGAIVEASLLQGTGLSIRGQFTLEDIDAFYRSEFARLGYSLVETSLTKDQVKIIGQKAESQGETLRFFAERSAKSNNRFSFVFIKTVGK